MNRSRHLRLISIPIAGILASAGLILAAAPSYAAVGANFFLHDSPSHSTNTNAVTRTVVNFGAPRTVTTAVVNFGAPSSDITDFSAISSSHNAAPQSLVIF